MAEMEFSRQDIEDLTRKVSTLQPYFSEKERLLLTAIFAAAAEHAKPLGPGHAATLPLAAVPANPPAPGTGTGAGPATLEDLQQQLLGAYLPGNSFDSVTHGGQAGRITGTQPAGTASSTAPPPAPPAPPG